MKTQETKIVFSSEKDEPDMELYTTLGFNSFWSKVKFAYNVLTGNVLFTSSFNFPNENEVKDTIDILKDKISVTSFNIVKSLDDAILPTKAHENDVGYDLHTPYDFELYPGETKRIDFGLIVEIQPGYEIQIRNRSSVVWKYHTMMALGVGSIDEDYRGHIMAPMYNFGITQILFKKGDRLAQMVIKKTESIQLKEGSVNLDTDRGSNGFGSSGK